MGIKEWRGAGPLSRSSHFHREWKAFNLPLWNSAPSFIRILKILYLPLPHMFSQNTYTLKLRSSNSCNKLFNHKSIKSKTKWDLMFLQRWWQKIQVFWDMTPCQLLTQLPFYLTTFWRSFWTPFSGSRPIKTPVRRRN